MEEVALLRKMTEDFAAQLQSATKALEEREEQLAKERQRLEDEQRMAAFVERTDIVEINVGGKVVATERGTLLLAKGTLLEAIFSGNFEGPLKHDGAGRVFLDYSPALFKAILSYLRATRDAKPGESVASPVVSDEYTAEYEAMVRYLDLAEFLAGNNTLLSSCPAAALMCSPSRGGTCDGSIRCNGGVLLSGANGHRCAVGGARLLGDGGSLKRVAWKVTVKANPGWFCAGVISNGSPGNNSFREATCWAWASNKEVWLAGHNAPSHGGWSGWERGDIAVFQLDVSDGLRMFLRRSQQVYRYHLQGMSTDVMKEARVHFNLPYADTEVEVSQVTAEDLREAGF